MRRECREGGARHQSHFYLINTRCDNVNHTYGLVTASFLLQQPARAQNPAWRRASFLSIPKKEEEVYAAASNRHHQISHRNKPEVLILLTSLLQSTCFHSISRGCGADPALVTSDSDLTRQTKPFSTPLSPASIRSSTGVGGQGRGHPPPRGRVRFPPLHKSQSRYFAQSWMTCRYKKRLERLELVGSHPCNQQ